MKHLMTALVSAGLLSACTCFTPSQPPAIKLYVFECGNIESRDVSMFSPGVNVGQTKQLTNSCYLIRHPKGDLIWDTGLSDSIGPEMIDVMNGAFGMSVTQPLLDQLQAIGVDPAQIDYLGISHFHGDHTGNANLFTNASLLIQAPEYDAAFGAEPQSFHFSPESYSQIDRNKIKVLEGDFDVFGDQRVVVKQAYGHTPGHQALFIDLPQSGPIVLSGDLYHFTDNRTHRRVPSFNFDKEQTLKSMGTIEAFVQETNARFWIQHDKEQNAEIKHSPSYYE